MGIKQMHLRRHAEAADEASPPSDDIPSDSQRALTVEKEQQEIRNYFDIVYKVGNIAICNLITNLPFCSVGNARWRTHFLVKKSTHYFLPTE